MLATPAVMSMPIHAARLHARPPGGIEPQLGPEAERIARVSERERLQRVVAAEAGARAMASGERRIAPDRGAAGAAPVFGSAQPGRGSGAGERPLPPAAMPVRALAVPVPVAQQPITPAAAGRQTPQSGDRPAGRPDGVSGVGPAAGEREGGEPPRASARATGDLNEAERWVLQELVRRDRVVRAHEEAHARVGGAHAGAPRYEFVVGPDGKRYAIGGRVQIDLSNDPSDPEATIAKMLVVKRAALAPVDPSPADRQVAALAERLRMAAEADLAAMKAAERAVIAALQTTRLTRLSTLFARTATPPASGPRIGAPS